jgi:hypothetical protein
MLQGGLRGRLQAKGLPHFGALLVAKVW